MTIKYLLTIKLLQLVANLHTYLTNEEGYFILGHDNLNVQAVDDKDFMKFSHNSVQSNKKVLGQGLTDLIPDGDDVPHGILLIKSEGASRSGTLKPNLPNLNRRNPFIGLGAILKGKLQNYLIFYPLPPCHCPINTTNHHYHHILANPFTPTQCGHPLSTPPR